MIGKEPTLKDICLEELPSAADELWCDEELPPEEAEPQPRPTPVPYRVHVTCGHCGRGLRLVVLTTRDGIRYLQYLLTYCMSICCPGCAERRQYYHHGG
ncbi:E7 [Martes foina papillomavirus 1]|uniref:Protein E7 n=1 Tax=Martes foina papillomavirus 1 TaxID=2831903 RepID=A0AAE7UTJ2_9PAPI|nr:E7 [Martes foina papillomavirus 1]